MGSVNVETMKQFMGYKGSVLELGVHRGRSAALMVPVAIQFKKALILVDSFKGMPDSPDSEDQEYYPEGKFSNTSVKAVRSRVGEYPTIIKGWLPDVLQYLPGPFSFVYLDIDHYQSTAVVLQQLWPKVSGGILCDDCVGHGMLAERAVNEFSKGRKMQVGEQILIWRSK